MGQLYGQFDPVSHEWTDGVLANTFREYASAQTPDRKWILFDGPVDAVWIENMNTVLDDNKKLCLMSGEIIQMSNSMNLIFEPADLEQASPATVSRCGMIYLEPVQMGWRPSMESYIKHGLPKNVLTEEHFELVRDLFEWLVDPCLFFIQEHCRPMVRLSDIHMVQSLIRLYNDLLDELRQPSEDITAQQIYLWLQGIFLFAFVWTVGSSLGGDSRKKFDQYFRNIISGTNTEHPKPKSIKITKSNSFPERATVFDFCFEKKGGGNWIDWMDTLERGKTEIAKEAKVNEIIVPTVETARQVFFLRTYIQHKTPMIFVGPTGGVWMKLKFFSQFFIFERLINCKLDNNQLAT